MIIVEELKKIAQINEKYDMLIPNYLYVEKYGRSIEEDIEEIAKNLGYSDWLIYYCSSLSNQKGLAIDFMNEVQKKERLGREYKGLVCIKIIEEINKDEWEDFLLLVSRYKERFTFLFSTNHNSNIKMIESTLKQYFYIRTKEATLYTPEEMNHILANFFAEHQIVIENNNLQQMTIRLLKHEWSQQDQVKNLIVGEIKGYLYNQFLNNGKVYEKFDLTDLEECMKNLSNSTVERKIGFILD